MRTGHVNQRCGLRSPSDNYPSLTRIAPQKIRVGATPDSFTDLLEGILMQPGSHRRIVVTGIGAVTPLAMDVPTFWSKLIAGESGIHDLTTLDTSKYKVHFGGDIPDFDVSEYVIAKEAKRLDRFTQFAVHAGGQAIADSGINFDDVDRTKCGVILGSGIGGLNEIEMQIERMLTKGPDRVSPFTVPKMMVNAAGGNISITYGLKRPELRGRHRLRQRDQRDGGRDAQHSPGRNRFGDHRW